MLSLKCVTAHSLKDLQSWRCRVSLPHAKLLWSVVDARWHWAAHSLGVMCQQPPPAKKDKDGNEIKAKGKKAKFDKEYVLRYNALYLSPLKDAMVAYAERDVNGAKAAGGAGLPKFNQRTSAPASASSLYQVKFAHVACPVPGPLACPCQSWFR